MTDPNPWKSAAFTREPTDGEPIDRERIERVASLSAAIVENVERVIVGNDAVVEDIVVCLLGRGHVLLEDVPGTGKTMLARAVARSIDCSFKRVQFTPDLLPSDVTGISVFNQKTREFEFQAGPVFANVVLADEINRAPPKTQSSLLEAMEEEQVTVDGTTRPVPDPFAVIATQNTIEVDRTYELPIAQIDRFMKRLELGYPSERNEVELLDRLVGGHPIADLEPVATVEDVVAAREVVANVAVREPIREYATRLARYTREHSRLGVSPRGTIALVRAAQGRAALGGRDYVVPDDVQSEAPAVLSHRVRVDAEFDDDDGRVLVERALADVSVP